MTNSAAPKVNSDSVTIDLGGGARLIFLTGKTGIDYDGAVRDPAGRVLAGGIVDQTKVAFARIEQALARVGATMNDIVRLTTYLTDMNDVAAYLGVRAGVFQRELPAASTVEVSAIGRQGALIEIDAIAHLGSARSYVPGVSQIPPELRKD